MGLIKLGAEKLSVRPLEFIWILDVSGSMHGERIASLNYAIKEAIPSLQEAAKGNVNAEIMMRVMTFASDVKWHVAKRTPAKDFEWQDLEAKGLTNLGQALTELSKVLDDSAMPERGLPPVLVLITDGEPTDDYQKGLEILMSKTWGRKAIRLAITISEEMNEDILEDFIGNKQIKPIKVENSSQLTQYLKVVSTQLLSNVSMVKPAMNPLVNFDFNLPEEKVKTPNKGVFDKF